MRRDRNSLANASSPMPRARLRGSDVSELGLAARLPLGVGVDYVDLGSTGAHHGASVGARGGGAHGRPSPGDRDERTRKEGCRKRSSRGEGRGQDEPSLETPFTSEKAGGLAASG